MNCLGGSLYGIGTDLVGIDRFRAHWPEASEEWSLSGLVKRVLTEAEIQQAHARWLKDAERGLKFFASRFAAKEALSKAFGTGIGEFFSFQDVSVLTGVKGEPVLKFSSRLEAWLSHRGLVAHISLADEGGFALAFATLSFYGKNQ